MSQAPRCPACDCELPADAPAGLCPQCLMLAGFNSGTAPDPGYAATAPHTPPGGFVPPTAQEIAPLFPQLEILQLLGQGGMGAVYKARQVGLDRLVAVKILPPEISRDPSFAERFTREARALARLSHPNIVAVYDFGRTTPVADAPGSTSRDRSLFYIVMEFVDGANLRQVIREKATTPPQALALVPQICEALQFAHDEGIVHRDIKPENILVDKRGRVKIADFGLAKMLGVDQTEGTLTGTHQVMGTIRYMAPEQLEGLHDVDHRADIYSLGVVFYELLTGELPIGRFAPPSKKVQIDVRLDEVVLRALEKEPEQRWQQASQVKTELTSIAGSSGRAMLDESQQVVARPRFSRRAIVAAVCAPLVFGAALPLMVAETVTTSGAVGNASPPAGVPIWIQIGAGLLTLLGVAAPFATTILGGMAVAEIRRSNGKLYGLPLAVADVLLFPLVLLDGLILTATAAAAMAILTTATPNGPRNSLGMSLPEILTLLVALPIIGWVDFRIVRAVWRNIAADGKTTKEDPVPTPVSRNIVPVWVIVAALLGLAMLGIVTFLSSWADGLVWAPIVWLAAHGLALVWPRSTDGSNDRSISKVVAIASWSVACTAVYFVLWLPVQDGPHGSGAARAIGYLDRQYWRWHGDADCTVSLTPAQKTFRRLTISNRRSIDRQGIGLANWDGVSPLAERSHDKFEVRLESLDERSQPPLIVDGLAGMSWQYIGTDGDDVVGTYPFDQEAALRWLKACGVTSQDESVLTDQARACAEVICEAVERETSTGFAWSSEERKPIGYLESIVNNQSHAWRVRTANPEHDTYPFSGRFGTHSSTYRRVWPLLPIGLATMGGIWLAGVWLIRTQMAGAPQASSKVPLPERLLVIAGSVQIVSAIATAMVLLGLVVDDSRFDAFFRSDAGRFPLVGAQVLGFLFGMLAMLGGTSLRLTNDARLAKIGAFTLLLPQTPAWIVTAPLAVWALLQLRHPSNEPLRAGSGIAATPLTLQSTGSPTYTRWVIAPMLVLTAIWIGASFAVSARSQGSAGGDYDPIRIMQVQLWGGVAVGLALPILLVLRWSRTLPPSVRAVFYTRNMFSVAVAVLAFAALVAYFISPWNQPHVESRGITFRPQSGAFSELKIGVGMLSHSRTTGRYRRPDVCEFTLDVGGYATRGRYTVDDVGSLTWHVGGEERAFDRERFISWLRSVAMLPLDQPAVRQEAEELASLVETWNRDAPGDFEVLFAIAQAGLADFDRGPDLPSRSYVQGNPRLGFFYAFGAICLAFIAALAINIVVARRSATTA